jgi:Zn-dependent peptidase ImmA (M78 family)/DNA-binding XRE family transcriptional regulator
MSDGTSDARPQLIILARESRGFSQSALAYQLAISQGTLSKIENGQASASDELIQKLSKFLNYPLGFFSQHYTFRNLPISFYRKRVSTKAAIVHAIRARINILRLHVLSLLKSVDIPECRVPFVDLAEYGGSPERVAQELRVRWHLPRGPIENLTRTLEDAGVIIIRCDFGTRQVDAVSFYEPMDDLPPMIFVSETIPGDRLRFSLAHETAHLILHSHLPLPGEGIEDEADRFASELLMPATDIRNFLTRPTLTKLATLKPYWGVAIQALLMRAGQLGQITERQRRYLWMQVSGAGYRTQEPLPIPVEEPTLISELIQTHLEELGYDDTALSKLLHLELAEFRSQYKPGSPKLRVLRAVFRQRQQA